MKVLAGTSGYSYREWKPSFYPADVAASRFLPYYASRFDTVEINATFRGIPRESTIEEWRAAVPARFVFALKAPQAITHRRRMRATEEAVAFFYERAALLGGKRGPVLFQLPPNLKVDLPRLVDFLAALPEGHGAVFEFRHPSWFTGPVYDALRARRAALCIAESEELETPFVATTDFGYLRLRGSDYSPARLREWRERILAQRWRVAYVYFKHEDEARGPKLAARFLAGIERSAHP